MEVQIGELRRELLEVGENSQPPSFGWLNDTLSAKQRADSAAELTA
jgi:hypothetical protein